MVITSVLAAMNSGGASEPGRVRWPVATLRWVMMPSVFARPVRSAAMAAPNEVISAKEPLMVISRRKTSNGW